MKIPIYWRYNGRIKNLVPPKRIVRGATYTFPKDAATVVMTDLTSPSPSYAIHLKSTGVSTYSGNAYQQVMRVRFSRGVIFASGYVGAPSFEQLPDIIQRVQSVVAGNASQD